MPNDSNEVEPYITAEEAAEYLGLSRQTIYNKCSLGQLPHYKSPSGLLRFRRSELDEWMRGQPVEKEA